MSDLFDKMREDLLNEPHFCSKCGRRMLRKDELTRERDSKTGERVVKRWLTCPKFPRNALIWLVRGDHSCRNIDLPLLGKRYM